MCVCVWLQSATHASSATAATSNASTDSHSVADMLPPAGVLTRWYRERCRVRVVQMTHAGIRLVFGTLKGVDRWHNCLLEDVNVVAVGGSASGMNAAGPQVYQHGGKNSCVEGADDFDSDTDSSTDSIVAGTRDDPRMGQVPSTRQMNMLLRGSCVVSICKATVHSR